ncbi:hypothetical protein B5P43_35995 [Bacillus sp. SRB_336]|nr:hypothetical protein B5P43_35995 [Bacillus sp. SRB_336]
MLAFVDAKLAYEIDVVAAAEAQAGGQQSWDHGHIAGALHLPAASLAALPQTLPRDRCLVVYGWGPGCNGATYTARRLLSAGFGVRELIGGYEYWVRNGFAIEAEGTTSHSEPDPLVTAEPHH